MTVKEILRLVCDFVGEKEIRAKLEGEEQELTAREQEDVNLMIRCLNLVRQEIASDYLPYLKCEAIDVHNSILNYSELSQTVIGIYEVRNRFGMSLKFKLFPNFVQIFGHAKSVVYSYLPADLTLEDEVESFNGLSARVYAYGVASEFLLYGGSGENAEIWENRFKDCLFMLSRKHGEHVLPRRRWI